MILVKLLVSVIGAGLLVCLPAARYKIHHWCCQRAIAASCWSGGSQRHRYSSYLWKAGQKFRTSLEQNYAKYDKSTVAVE